MNGDPAALSEPVHVPAQRRSESEFVEQRRMEKIGDRAQLIRNLPGSFDARRQPPGEFWISHRQFAFDSRKLELQGREYLSGAVVQVARNAAAFVVLHAQQPCGKVAQIFVALLELRGPLAYPELQLHPAWPQPLVP